MNQNSRVFTGILAVAAIAAGGFALDARAAEGDPGWDCHTQGNRVCGTPQVRTLVSRLAQRPALTLPGQWTAPAGPALVQECFDSYPGNHGKATPELIGCLSQPDPRKSDPRVMTVAHYQHLQHLHHLHVLHLKHIGR